MRGAQPDEHRWAGDPRWAAPNQPAGHRRPDIGRQRQPASTTSIAKSRRPSAPRRSQLASNRITSVAVMAFGRPASCQLATDPTAAASGVAVLASR